MNDFVTDPALPGINTALDVKAIQELFQNTLPECRDDFELSDVKVMDVQYKPGVYCKLLYRLKARDRQSNRTLSQLVSATLLRKGETLPAVPQEMVARYEPNRKTILRAPVVYFPALQMIAYAFPVDSTLPWLSEALDPNSMKQQLRRNWAWRNLDIRKVAVRPIGYTPQARAAIFCEVLTETKDTKEPEMRRLIGKIHGFKPAALLFSGAWALWRAVNHNIRVAPPIGYISSLRLTFQEHVRGERLTEFAHMGSFIKPVKKTARAIAIVHRLTLPLTSVRTPEKEAGVVRRWKAVLAAICPEHAQRIENLSNRLSGELITRAQVQRPVHGDFHPANVMWDNDHITLVDLDDLSYGDPLVDVGRFLASLRVSAHRVSSEISALDHVGDAFLQQYFKQNPEDEKRARLFEASSLLIAACAPFRLQRPGWKEAAVLLLDETERVWENSRGITVSVNSGDPHGLPLQAVPSQSGLGQATPPQWIVDGVYMRTVLDPHIRKIYDADLVSCRAEMNDNQEVAYELFGWRGEAKWTIQLRGTVRRHHGGGAVLKQLEKLHARMAESSDTPVLPRPVAYLRPFSLIVWEPPTGISFESLMRKPDALEKKAASVARALAILHSTDVEIKSQCSREDELRALRGEVEQLEKSRNVLFNRATTLLREVEQRVGSIPWQQASVLRRVHPRDVLFQQDRVAFSSLEKLTKSHPHMDAADFLARVTLVGIRRNQITESQKAANSFREAYLAEGWNEEDLTAFEIAALLRLACRCAARDSEAQAPGNLLDYAVARLTSMNASKK